MTIPDRHYFNVGRVAVDAANLEGKVAAVIFASEGGWDGITFNEHLQLATHPDEMRKRLQQIAQALEAAGSDSAASARHVRHLRSGLKDVLGRRNVLVHSTVERSLFALGTARAGDLGMTHPHAAVVDPYNATRPLAADEDVAALLRDIESLEEAAERLLMPIAVAAQQGVFSGCVAAETESSEEP